MIKRLFSGESRKAWLAGVAAALTAFIAGNNDGVLDLTDWLTAALAGVTAVGTVYGIKNKDKMEVDE